MYTVSTVMPVGHLTVTTFLPIHFIPNIDRTEIKAWCSGAGRVLNAGVLQLATVVVRILRRFQVTL